MGSDTDNLVARLKAETWAGPHEPLYAEAATEIQRLTAALSACTARYNKAVLDAVRMRAALLDARGTASAITSIGSYLADRLARASIAAIDAALSAGRGEGETLSTPSTGIDVALMEQTK